MPSKSRGAHLWLRPARRRKSGRVVGNAIWIIVDASKHIATGCSANEAKKAEAKLAQYIASKHKPARKQRTIEQISIADVISIYVDDRKLQDSPDASVIFGRLHKLNEFWGAMTLADINGETCRAYADQSNSLGAARRELEDLRAAVNHHAKEGYHRELVRIVLPEKGSARERWLTRDEVAHLLWMCWCAREYQTIHSGASQGQPIATERRPLRHLVRFILLALYTGTRASAVVSASIKKGQGKSFVDLDNGVFYRLAEGKRETKKRQTPVPIPPRLLAHLRRWKRKGIVRDYIVEWNGQPVKSVKKAFSRAVSKAGLSGNVSPHVLRHTCATWLLQAGVDKWEAAGFLGLSLEVLEKTYAHHHRDHLQTAARVIGYKPRTDPLVMPLAAPKSAASNRS